VTVVTAMKRAAIMLNILPIGLPFCLRGGC